MKNELKILMLEDSEDDVGLIALALKRDGIPFVFQQVDNRDDFSFAIDNFKPDLILSDHALPQFNSIEAFKVYREKNILIPFILVTGTVSEEFAVNVLKKGVDDYILKSNLSRLPSAIFNAIGKRKSEKEKLEANEELKRQNKKLIKANQDLDSFVYSLSHNLRGPLRSVLGLITLTTIENQLESSAVNSLSMMKSSLTKLDKTLDDIVEYSRDRHDKIENQKIEVKSLVDDCFHHFLRINDSDKIERQIDVQDKSPFYSDPGRLTIVLRNLISNSIQFRNENLAKTIIKISFHTTPEQAIIIVDDNGIGIAKEVQPKIFDLFYRGNERSQGDGLGLYIVREIVNRLQGSIDLNTTVNKGTQVIVTIPNQNKIGANA